MDGTYRKFLESGLDLTALGVERRAENAPYFCTPKGANIFGWAGWTASISALSGASERRFLRSVLPMGRGNSYTRLRRILRIFSGCCWPAGTVPLWSRRGCGTRGHLTLFFRKTRLRRNSGRFWSSFLKPWT